MTPLARDSGRIQKQADCGKGMVIGMTEEMDRTGGGKKEPVRVLHVLGGLSLGGAESRIMDLYRCIDRNKVQFDFLVHQDGAVRTAEFYDEEVKKMGGRIYILPKFKVYNYVPYKKAVKEFFENHREFVTVQGHMTSTASLYLPVAKKAGIPVTAAHARSAGVDKGLKGIITRLLRLPLQNRADYCFACSKEAGESVFGKKWTGSSKALVLPNAIDAGRFIYGEETRKRIRAELGIEDCFVLGHVGRFHYAKNHEFLLEIFASFHDKMQAEGKKTVLLLLGEGSSMDERKKQAEALGIAENVFFLGNKQDVWNYYQAMDYFVFPSRFEGLPGTVVEAQAAGLRCIISDRITPEVGFSKLVHFESIDKSAGEWADYIKSHSSYERKNRYEEVRRAGFDVAEQAVRMERFYRTGEIKREMKKKIMLIVPMLHQGGFERVCVTTARLLEPFCDVYIVVFDSKDIAYDIKGLNVIDLHMGVKGDIGGKVLNVMKRSFAVRKLKKKLEVDIAYSFGPTANLVNVFSGKCAKIWVGIRSYMDMGNPRKINLFAKRADKVLCCSKIIEEEIASEYHCKKAVTLYNPLDIGELRNKAGEGNLRLPWETCDHIVASMGREDDVKGFWHLMKSFSLLQKEVPDAKLVIIGEGSFEEYRTLAKRLNIADKVYFTGMKKNPFPYLNAAEIYVLTSYHEGFPNALIEAMALGVPVIATDCMTGPREILLDSYISEKEELADGTKTAVCADYGVLIPNMDPKKDLDADVISEEEKLLAGEMKRMMTDEEYRRKYSEAAIKRALDFSDEYYVADIRRFMDEISCE